MESKQVFYYYPKDRFGRKLGHSIAAVLKDEKVFMGFSQLSSKDVFNKKIGRKIAEARAWEQLQRFESRKRKNVTL
jgi:hypothetical protein